MPDSIYYSYHQVATKDCTHHRTIKLTSLLDCLQDAAWKNAMHLGFSTLDLLKNDITWVMNRMKIQFNRYPSDNEEFTIETWPSGMNKYYTTRDFKVWDSKQGLLAKATSNWLIMDIKERKLISIPDDIKGANFIVDRGNVEAASGKFKYDLKKTTLEKQINVSWFDLDINDHVNNTKFYQWVLDSLDRDFLDNHQLKEIDIVFKHEGKYGDQFTSKSYFESNEGVYYHTLINKDTGLEHVSAKTCFVPV